MLFTKDKNSRIREIINPGIVSVFIGITVLTMAMPATSIISERYGGDSALASRCAFLTTVFSSITYPYYIYLDKNFNNR